MTSATICADSPPSLRRYRIGVSLLFFVNGALFATWVSRIPAIKHQLALSDSDLGLALFAMTVGALGGFPLSSWLIARQGSREVATASAFLSCLAIPLAGFATNLVLLGSALILLGAALSAMDVAMNSQAVDVEKAYGRSIMVAFHGLWSLGGLVGAGAGSWLAGMDAAPQVHFSAGAGLLGIVTMLAAPRLYLAPPHPREAPIFALPSRAVFAVGSIAFCSFIVEGAIADWSGVYLRDTLGTSFAFAAAGYAAYSAAMTVGRFCGDRVVERFGRVPSLRAGALLAACALALALVGDSSITAVAGFMVAGFGLAVVVPLAFTAAGRHKLGGGGSALAAVATMGYGGGLAGPPFIGFAAAATSLAAALFALVALCIVIALLARAVDFKNTAEQENMDERHS